MHAHVLLSSSTKNNVLCWTGRPVLWQFLAVPRSVCTEQQTPLQLKQVVLCPWRRQMLTTVNGKERSERELRVLLRSAGFELARVWRVRSPVALVEARLLS